MRKRDMSVRGMRTAVSAGASALIVLGAAVIAAEPTATRPEAGAPVRFVPEAKKMSTYTQMMRVEITNKHVSFEAPPAYQESFAFWTGQMRDVGKTELAEFTLSTLEPEDDGSLPFTRRVSKFMIEILKKGRPMEPYGPLKDQVRGFVWDGAFDEHGNVIKLKKTAGLNVPEEDDLSFPMMDSILPRLEPLELEIGEGFDEEVSLPLPSRLKIQGLQDIRLIRRREYRLKSASPALAKFEIKTTYANDPESPPTVPETSCAISGEGTGTADFDLRRGVFVILRHTGLLEIDIEAPLRPLPGKPETSEGGRATTRLELEVRTSVRQKVERLWGKEDE
jgi:hypothetical protein